VRPSLRAIGQVRSNVQRGERASGLRKVGVGITAETRGAAGAVQPYDLGVTNSTPQHTHHRVAPFCIFARADRVLYSNSDRDNRKTRLHGSILWERLA
jgi:hypothetical protein